MDPDKQDALNSIENSIYRTAFKLRSLQTMCQLDLIDSSQIQHVLLRQSFWEARESPLSVKCLFQAVQELFQGVRVEEPGQVHPRASELTLSLLTTMYDSTGTGFLKLAPAAAALIALSGDSPLTKYRALFQLYAENNRGGYDSGARMTRRVLRNLLTDLQQIPAVVGESRALCSVESAIRSCFQGVLSPAIKEEKFLSWLQSEPPILLWLPTCHQLSATEMVTHPVRCRICRNFPITGLRYRCLKCLNFDICQLCFLSGLHSKSHQKSHPVTEHRVQEMSAKENTKLLLRTLRNNLLQVGFQRKEAATRQWLRAQVNPKDTSDHAPASSKVPMYVSPVGPAQMAAMQASTPVRQRTPQAPPTHTSSPRLQTIVSMRNELWRTRECINALQRERRYDSLEVRGPAIRNACFRWKPKLNSKTSPGSIASRISMAPTWKNVASATRDSTNSTNSTNMPTVLITEFLKKQLNRHKDKLQAIYASQEEKSCKFETKIHELTANQHSLWTKLQQMGQNLQAMLQPLHSSSSCQNMVSKGDHGMGEQFWKEEDSSRIKNAIEDGSEWKPLPNPTVADRSQQSQTKVEDALPKSESPQAILQPRSMQSTKAQSQTQETTREIFSSSSSSQEGPLQDTLQTAPAEINSPTLSPMERRETGNIQEEKDELEEEELQELFSKLMDAFTLEMPSDPQSSVNMDLYCGAERVGRAFSALVDQITLANLR